MNERKRNPPHSNRPKGGLTLCTHSSGAVFGGFAVAFAHLAPVPGRWSVTLSPPLPVTLATAPRPLAPLLPASVNCTHTHTYTRSTAQQVRRRPILESVGCTLTHRPVHIIGSENGIWKVPRCSGSLLSCVSFDLKGNSSCLA